MSIQMQLLLEKNLFGSTGQIKLQASPCQQVSILSLSGLNLPQPPQVSIRRGASKLYQSPIMQNTVGDWKLYATNVEANLNDYIEINGANAGTTTPSGSTIDEVRLHPFNTLMETYTLEPLFGIRTKNTANNYVLYYEYDIFGRPYQIRDLRGNIISKTENVFMGDDQYSDPNGSGSTNTNY